MSEEPDSATSSDAPLEAHEPSRTWRVFSAPESPVTWRRAIGWWEERRPVYNLVMLVMTTVSLFVFLTAIISSGKLAPGEDAIEPLGLIVGVVLFPLAINLCYTLGWLVELAVRAVHPATSARFGPRLLAVGLVFSVVLVCAPAVGWLVILAGVWLKTA